MTLAHGGCHHAHRYAQVDFDAGIEGDFSIFFFIEHHINPQRAVIVRGNDAVEHLYHIAHHLVKVGVSVEQELVKFFHGGYPTRAELAVEVTVKNRVACQLRLAVTALALDGKILYLV